MAMTRKHFKAIAAAIREANLNNENEREAIRLRIVTEKLADVCKADNDRFNKAKFMEACGF